MSFIVNQKFLVMKKVYLMLLLAMAGFGIVNAQYHELPKTGWTALADTFQAGRPGSNAIDGDPSTLWHSPWDGNTYPQPHWIVVDFGKEIDIDGFSYLPRSGAGNGTIKTWGFYMAGADSVWMLDDSLHGEFGDPWDIKHDVLLQKTYHVRYMKLISWEERWGQGFTSCAEFGALRNGADFTADNPHILRGESVQFHNKSYKGYTSLQWTFQGGTPATSTEENPVVKYSDAGEYDVMLVAVYADRSDTLLMKKYVMVDIPTVDRSGWIKLYVDSEQGGRPAENVWDGDPATIWHTEWSPSSIPYPHTLVIDMGAKIQVEGFIYTPRPGGGNGTVKDYEFYVLEDTAMWTDPGTWGSPVASGAWAAPWNQEKRVFLSKPVLGRYLIFYTLSEKNNNDWTSCAELNVMGTLFGSTFKANRTEIYETQKVDFTGGPDGKKAYHWILPGGDPATSDEQNPSVKYSAAGTYDVTLITTSAADDTKDTLVRSNYIKVKPRKKNKPLDKDGWSVIAWDSQEEPNGRYASDVIDGDLSTFWHTAWSQQQDPYPHFVIIDMGKNEDISGFVYYPRPGGGNGTVDSCAWLVSIDGEIWDTVAIGSRGSGSDWAAPWSFDLDKIVTARFVQFLALSERGYPENPGHVWASCAEIDVTTPIKGTYFEAEPLRIESGETVYYLDLTAGTPSAWSWTFEKGDPQTTNEQSPEVTYNIPYEQLGMTFSATLTATVDGKDETFTRSSYVKVDYYDPNSGGGVYLDTVQVGDVFQNLSGNDGKFIKSDKVITVVKGSKYVMNLAYYQPWNGSDNLGYNVGIGAFVDWNMDYHFDKDEEGIYYEYTDKIVSGNYSSLFYLDVPSDAKTGLTRMRLYAGVWCGNDPYTMWGYGEVEDYTLKIVDAPTEAPKAQFTADTTEICAGGSIRFEYVCDDDAQLATSWKWYFPGAEDTTSTVATPTVTYDTPGTYAVGLVVANDNGDDSIMVAAYVKVYGSTPINAGDDDKVCPGSEVVLDVTEVDSVVWNNGVIDGEPFYPTDSLVYVATGYNEHNCVATDTVIIAVWDAVDTSVMKYGEDTLVALGDSNLYVFQWIYADDGTPIEGATNKQFVAEHGGNYAVVVTQIDGGQCSDTSSVYKISITGIRDNFGDEISIYPNPNNGDFTVDIGREHATISVYNTIGSMIYRKEDANPVEHLSLDAEGVYFLKIELNGVTETRRVVVR